MEKLKPCPFCWGENLYVSKEPNPDQYQVICNADCGGCGASSGFEDTSIEAIEAWNRRADVKHGKWIKDGDGYALYKCTACNDLCTVAGYADCISEEQMHKTFKFCPNCGARMERSEEWEK